MTLTERLDRIRHLLDVMTASGSDVHLISAPEGWMVLVSCPTGAIPPFLRGYDDGSSRPEGGWHLLLAKRRSVDESLCEAERRMTDAVKAWIHREWIRDPPPNVNDAELVHRFLISMEPLPTKHPKADDHDS